MHWIIRPLSAGPRLDDWEARPATPGVDRGPRPQDARDRSERVVAWEEPGPPRPGGAVRRLADAVLSFDVFPPGQVTAVLRRRPVRVGDAAGVCYHFLPGLDLFFAARVIEVFDEADGPVWRAGFTYRTLEGHPACGEETFSVEKDLRTGSVLVALRSWSRPGLWLARAARPVMRLLQRRAALGALDHLESLAQAGPGGPPVGARRDLRTGLLRGGGEW